MYLVYWNRKDSRSGKDFEQYWTGEVKERIRGCGRVQQEAGMTRKYSKALKFMTAREAYDHAGKFPVMYGRMATARVGKRSE